MRLLLAFACICATLVSPTLAVAEVRVASAGDPQEVSSSTWQPDIEQARATYDTDGTLVLTVRFYRPIPNDPADESVFWTLTGSSCGGGDIGTAWASIRDPSSTSVSIHSSGDSDTVPATAEVSGDRRELTISAGPTVELARRDFRCLRTTTDDDETEVFYFAGYEPAPDQPPSVDEFKANYSPCIKDIAIEFEWADDSSGAGRWSVAFVRRGLIVAVRSGSANNLFFPLGNATLVRDAFHLPRSMKVGRAYRAYLAVTDSTGQSSPILSDRLRARRC